MTTEGYMFFIGDTPMNCVGSWRVFWDEDVAYRYLKPGDLPRTNVLDVPRPTLRRVRVTVEVVE